MLGDVSGFDRVPIEAYFGEPPTQSTAGAMRSLMRRMFIIASFCNAIVRSAWIRAA